ncbi:MAG TPA: hypothetical protein VF915_20430, partial [Reyranella sp.]
VRGLEAGASVDDVLKCLEGSDRIKASPDAKLISDAVGALRLPHRSVDATLKDLTLIEKEDVVAKFQPLGVAYLRYYSEIGRRYSFSDGAPSAE